MKCRACDEILSDQEAVRKYLLIDEYIDLCNTCLSYIKEDLEADSEDKVNIPHNDYEH